MSTFLLLNDLDWIKITLQINDKSLVAPVFLSYEHSWEQVILSILVSPKQDMSSTDMQICKLIAPSNAPNSLIRECRCDGPCGEIKACLHFAKIFKTVAINSYGKFIEW